MERRTFMTAIYPAYRTSTMDEREATAYWAAAAIADEPDCYYRKCPPAPKEARIIHHRPQSPSERRHTVIAPAEYFAAIAAWLTGPAWEDK